MQKRAAKWPPVSRHSVAPPTLSIVIVNWNTGVQLRDCIQSILATQREHFVLTDVIVVDNASSDGSTNGINELGISIQLIRHSENRGFAAACNHGASIASGDYLLFLNPDTRLLEESLEVPLAYMHLRENARVGVCGIQLIDERGRSGHSYARFPSLIGITLRALGIHKMSSRFNRYREGVIAESEGVKVVDQVIGAFFVVRKKLFQRLGGFDERFFVYFEEVDFSWRAKKQGWTSVCLDGARCIHIGGGASRQVKAARLFYSLRSRILFGFKHFTLPAAILLVVISLLPEFFTRLIYSLLRGTWTGASHVVKGYAMLIKELPVVLASALRMRREQGLSQEFTD